MSGDRYEIGMDELGCWVRQLNETWACVMHFTQDSESLQERIAEKVIRQQARDIAALKDALAEEVTANEAFRKAGGARDDEDMPTFCARLIAERDAYKHDALALMKINTGAIQALEQTEKERDQLRTDLAAAVAENAALLAANRDLKAHFDALKGDYDEAAHFARHFIRDDAAITPRGAIIRLGDKCTSLFARMKIAETERDEWIACHAQLYRKLGNLLAVIHRDGGHYESEHGTEKACEDAETAVHVMRGCVDGFISSANEWRQRAEQAEARLAAIEAAPTVAVVLESNRDFFEPHRYLNHSYEKLPPIGTELIARPAKD